MLHNKLDFSILLNKALLLFFFNLLEKFYLIKINFIRKF